MDSEIAQWLAKTAEARTEFYANRAARDSVIRISALSFLAVTLEGLGTAYASICYGLTDALMGAFLGLVGFCLWLFFAWQSYSHVKRLQKIIVEPEQRPVRVTQRGPETLAQYLRAIGREMCAGVTIEAASLLRYVSRGLTGGGWRLPGDRPSEPVPIERIPVDIDVRGADESQTADFLRTARSAVRKTQEHVAMEAGVSVRTIQRAEATEKVSVENLRSICAALDVRLELALAPAAEATPGSKPIWAIVASGLTKRLAWALCPDADMKYRLPVSAWLLMHAAVILSALSIPAMAHLAPSTCPATPDWMPLEMAKAACSRDTQIYEQMSWFWAGLACPSAYLFSGRLFKRDGLNSFWAVLFYLTIVFTMFFPMELHLRRAAYLSAVDTADVAFKVARANVGNNDEMLTVAKSLAFPALWRSWDGVRAR